MKAITAIIFMMSALWLASGCYYDSEEYLYPQINATCDTVNTYALSIVPLLQNHCLSCHKNSSAAASGGNIRLENYSDVKARADDHKLLGSVAHENGYSPMPMGASQLDNCQVTTFRIWINAGALQN
jgi:hypothetical protein